MRKPIQTTAVFAAILLFFCAACGTKKVASTGEELRDEKGQIGQITSAPAEAEPEGKKDSSEMSRQDVFAKKPADAEQYRTAPPPEADEAEDILLEAPAPEPESVYFDGDALAGGLEGGKNEASAGASSDIAPPLMGAPEEQKKAGKPMPEPMPRAPLRESVQEVGKLKLKTSMVAKQRRGQADQAKPTYEGFGQAFDEVWVIQAPGKRPFPNEDQNEIGSGELRAKPPQGGEEVPLPLKHTDVNAEVKGYVASVRVTQQYHNPYAEKIEAVYVFPLPENAAVSDFIMTIGERKIRGIIREKEEAKQIYQQAKNQGYVASLLTQERPNVFTQKVANIEPGKEIDIDITYFNTLKYSEGEYEFVFPMVVGPRYNPPGTSDGIGAVGRGHGGASGQSTEVQYLKPGERSGHDISLAVNIDAGVSIEKIYSNTHAIEKERLSPSKARVVIKASDSLPNKDFVLRYRVAGNKVKTALMTERDETGGYFTLIIQPPANLKDLPRTPKEMVFVLDCSGSMNGWPMDKAKKAMRRAIKNLSSDDSFQIIRFSNNSSALGPAPIQATKENIDRALSYVEQLRGSGGTQMIEGVKAALDFPHDENRYRIVSFMTDGYIGNEAQILGEVDKRLGASRIFSFGVGSSVNRYLIERMAKIGKGAVAYLTTNDSDVEAVDLFYDRIGHPGLADIKIDWGEMEVSDVYPKNIPDLFVGRPIIITGRFKGRGEAEVKVKGRVAGESQTLSASVNLDGLEGRQVGISKIWARAKIADLMDSMAATGAQVQEDVKQTALTHGLVSAYTAFVAVDSTRRTEGDHGTTAAVPVPMPEGVKYETTVAE